MVSNPLQHPVSCLAISNMDVFVSLGGPCALTTANAEAGRKYGLSKQEVVAHNSRVDLVARLRNDPLPSTPHSYSMAIKPNKQ